MTRRLIVSYLIITVFVLAVLEIPLGIFMAQLQRERLESDLQRDALVLATIYEDALDSGAPFSPEPASDYATQTGGRVVVVDANGISIVDTGNVVDRDFSTRPEIAAALTGQTPAPDTRNSQTLGRQILFVAVPVASGGEVHGAVRITFDPEEVNALVRRYWWGLTAMGAVVLAAVAIVGWIIARSVTRPLLDMRRAAIAAGGGDLSVRIDPGEAPEEVHDVAEAFNAMTSRLADLIERQRRFVGDASHELRTPLTALRLRLENLEGSVTSEDRKEVEAALAETERLSTLVDQLLTIARSESTERSTRPLDLAEAVTERVALWQAVAEESGVELLIDVRARPTVVAVERLVEHVIDNLVSNAISVSDRGMQVVIGVDESDEGGLLWVIDEGPGMPAEDRERAFDRFWRGDHQRPGTGLGLAIVHDLVTASGGTVVLEESARGGVAAKVALPADAVPLPGSAGADASGDQRSRVHRIH
jgi:signal transduction histidine kinase